MIYPNFLLLVSLLFVAYSQPDHPIFAALASCFGYAIFFYALSFHKSKKFIIGSVWFFAVQLVQLSWMAAPHYHGSDIYYAYAGIALWLSLQWGLLALFFTEKISYYRLLAMASFWALSEYSRLFVLCGFPFNPIGQSLAYNLISLQWASAVGILGLSFWVLLTNLCVYKWWKEKSIYTGSIAAAVIAIPYFFGSWNIQLHKRALEHSKPVRMALVQTGFYAEEKTPFKDRQDDYIPPVCQWQKIIGKLEAANPKGFDLIVLPECTVSLELFDQEIPADEISILPKNSAAFVSSKEVAQAIADHFGCELIMGIIYHSTAKEASYNSAVHFSPKKQGIQMYHKRVLVPLSEYLPFSFVHSIVEKHGINAFFTAGQEAGLFYGAKVVAPSICYEECFSHIMRQARNGGAQMFANVSNDVWFPHTRLPIEHFHLGKLRAVENGIPLVRACNTGITAGVDCLGKVVGRLPEKTDPEHFLQDVLVAEIPSYGYKTLFSRAGNAPTLAISFFALSTFLIFRKKYRL